MGDIQQCFTLRGQKAVIKELLPGQDSIDLKFDLTIEVLINKQHVQIINFHLVFFLS